ncbi:MULTISPECIES: methyltransferase domain-containing protein [unclassified Streptomyces]|uniref:methyltransferase domain-containing protein n=1 Tax=unclassified Streptomyces TaxID=2593676 RepID=UPI0006F29529|nr:MULTISPECIES: methyltransferase domain-containing protein [unclassified Streptomyces]KQX47877.1 methyltransferase [Streptomyces sp. Root1304]KRA82269.1 methyltransferase [Streptomyces sp. Root66D1]
MAETSETFDTAMTAWREWQEAPWGRIRYAVAEMNLMRHLDGPAAEELRVLDLAGGDGGDALRLAARGHHVTVVDYAPAMLAAAETRAAAAGLSERVTCVRADVTALPSGIATGEFDVVLCHNLLAYVDDMRGTLATALAPLKSGGLFSVMALNRHSAPLNIAVREMDPDAALAALDDDRLRNTMFDTELVLHTAEEVTGALQELGCRDVAHYGIRGFCDYITDDARKYDPDYYARLERLELATTARPPYMHTARLFQLTARKGGAQGVARG